MDSLRNIAPNLWATNDEAEIYFYLRDRELSIAETSLVVKDYFDGHDYILAIYDGKERNSSILLLIERFTENTENFFVINQLFGELLTENPLLTAILQGQNKIQDMISMLPTFQEYFKKKPQNDG